MILYSRTRALRSQLPAALALGALAVMSAGAQAAAPDTISILAPTVTTVGRDYATGAPIEERMQKASVKVDPETLTTNSGVALLKDSVFEAAFKICHSISFSMSDDDDNTCVRGAVESARGQVDAVIARARNTTNH